MIDCLIFGLSNAVFATGIAIIAIAVARWGKHPHLAHALWLLVFIKLVTPPLIPMNVLDARGFASLDDSSAHATPVPTLAEQSSVGRPSTFDNTALRSDTGERTEVLPVRRQSTTSVEAPLDSRPPEIKPTRVTPNPAVELAQLNEPIAKPRKAIEPSREDAWTEWGAAIGLRRWKWLASGLMLIWITGAVFLLTRSCLRIRTFYRLLLEAAPADARLRQFVAELSQRVGLSFVPQVRVVSGNLSPMVFSSGWKTYLIIPRDLVNWLSDKCQFETLIAHELAHVRRRDHWVRRFELVVTCLFWWLPTVWLAKRGIREAEEEICDAWVVAMLPQAHRTYAEALLNTADFLQAGKWSLPPMSSAISHFRFIKRRIVMIMQGSVPTRLAWSTRLLVWMVGAAFLPLSIGFAQKNDSEKRDFPPVEGVIAAKKAEVERKLERRIAKQDDQDELDAEEIKAILAEVREELASELGGLDEEIQEAMAEVQEELQEELADAPPEMKKLLAELDINSMLDEAMADAPKSVRSFVKSLNIEGMIAEALQDVDLDEIEIDEKEFREMKKELEKELGQELKVEMKEMSRELAEARREVKEAMRELPPEARAVLKNLNLDEMLRESLGDSHPLVKEIVDEVGVLEIIEDAIEADGELADRRDDDDEEDEDEEVVDAEEEDELSSAEDKLQRRLDELMEEVQAIRKELNRVKRLRK